MIFLINLNSNIKGNKEGIINILIKTNKILITSKILTINKVTIIIQDHKEIKGNKATVIKSHLMDIHKNTNIQIYSSKNPNQRVWSILVVYIKIKIITTEENSFQILTIIANKRNKADIIHVPYKKRLMY